MKLPHVGTSIFPVMTALAKKHGAINLAQGFPGFGANKSLLNLVSKHVDEGKNQYAPLLGLISLREKLAEKIADLYGYAYNPENEIWLLFGGIIGSLVAAPGVAVVVVLVLRAMAEWSDQASARTRSSRRKK